MTAWTLTAKWLVPGDRPPLPGGVVTILGEKIVRVEPHGRTRPDVDLGDAIVLPGLVNAHTHLDLTGLRGLAPPSTDFPGWLRQVIAFRRQRSPEQVRADIAAGVAECLRTGTTLIGDISGDGGSWDILAASSLRAVVFRELLGLPADRAVAAEALGATWASANDTAQCQRGVSPHAPYSVRRELFAAAGRWDRPLTVHLAETPAELELLRDHAGPFVDFLQAVGVYDSAGLARDVGEVIRLCAASGAPVLLAHGNYLPADVDLPPNVSVVYCPRTHAAFGHPPHPVADLLRRGVRVALGTDSLASNPDLDLLAEARFLAALRPDLAPADIVAMMTYHAAAALGDEAGSIAAGRSADLCVVPTTGTDEPYTDLLTSTCPVVRTMLRGAWQYDSRP